MLEQQLDQPQVLRCYSCGDSRDTRANPLIEIDSSHEGDEGPVYVHLYCAQRDRQLGFCRFCAEGKAFYRESLNEAGECNVHEGESIPSCPVEDIESYIENVQKNA